MNYMEQQQLSQFVALLDMIANPAKLKATIQEASDAAEALRKAKEEDRKIRDIDTWRGEVEGQLRMKAASLEKREEEFAKRLEENLKKVEADQKSLDDRHAELMKAMVKDKELKDMKAVLMKDAAVMSDKMKELKDKEASLVEREAKVAAREDAIKKAMGL